MPGYKSHLVGGLCAYGMALYAVQLFVSFTVPAALEWLLFALTGSLFPDVDTKSKGQKLFYLLMFCVFCLMLLRGQLEMIGALSFLLLIPIIVPHRGLFHRLSFIIAFALVLVVWCVISTTIPCRVLLFDAFFFIVGAFSHLVLDFGFMKVMRN
jgi:hypothetical protein